MADGAATFPTDVGQATASVQSSQSQLPANAYVGQIYGGTGGPISVDTGILLSIGQLGTNEYGLYIPKDPLLFDNLFLTPADSGRVITLTAADSAFAGFADLLSNGVENAIAIQVLGNHSGSGGLTSESESSLFTSSTGAPFPFTTDFHGQQIESISLIVTSVYYDPVERGIDFRGQLAVQVAVPEPASLVLCGLGLLTLIVASKRRA
jgi:hypothetical protein